MDVKKTMEAIKVMQAYVDGKEIEQPLGDSWTKVTLPVWDWYRNRYRVKPEPQTLWVIRHRGNKLSLDSAPDKNQAERNLTQYEPSMVELVEFREVMK